MKVMKLFTGTCNILFIHAFTPLWSPHSYEIQLEPEVRRKGLGKFLMQILELIGHRYIIIMMLSDQRKRFDKSSSEVIKFTGNPIQRICRYISK